MEQTITLNPQGKETNGNNDSIYTSGASVLEVNGLRYTNIDQALVDPDEKTISYITDLCENFIEEENKNISRKIIEEIYSFFKKDYGFIIKEGTHFIFDLSITHFYRQDESFMNDLHKFLNIIITKEDEGLAKKDRKKYKQFKLFGNRYNVLWLKRLFEDTEYVGKYGINYKVLFQDLELKSLQSVGAIFSGNPLKHKTFFK